MYITSASFVIFLCLVFLGYYVFFRRFQWQFLLLASFVFYAFSGLSNLIFISVTILSTWFSHLQMDKLLLRQEALIAQSGQSPIAPENKQIKVKIKKKRRAWLVGCLVFNFAILFTVKYSNFAILNINSLIKAFGGQGEIGLLNIILPLGISFYTFQTMSLLIDSYRAKKSGFAQRSVFKLALFTSFFPQLFQGPISRWGSLGNELFGKKSFDGTQFSNGLMRVLWGYFKKLVVADRLMVCVRFLINNTDEYAGVYTLINVIFYAITLYADFSGGIDVTIGVAKMLGINLAENFNMPYYSKNIAEYWRRWHITMGTWFRDYLFYPLTTSKPVQKMQKHFRKRNPNGFGVRLSVYLCTMLVWFSTGLWHGASWTFIIWGLANGIVIVLSTECKPLYDKFHARVGFSNTKGYDAFQIVRCFILIAFINSIDVYSSIDITFKAFSSVFTQFNFGMLIQQGLKPLGLGTADYIVAAAGVLTMILAGVISRRLKKPLSYGAKAAICITLFLTVLVFGLYGIGYDANQFIYEQV